jgi:hypothetical protein
VERSRQGTSVMPSKQLEAATGATSAAARPDSSPLRHTSHGIAERR